MSNKLLDRFYADAPVHISNAFERECAWYAVRYTIHILEREARAGDAIRLMGALEARDIPDARNILGSIVAQARVTFPLSPEALSTLNNALGALQVASQASLFAKQAAYWAQGKSTEAESAEVSRQNKWVLKYWLGENEPLEEPPESPEFTVSPEALAALDEYIASGKFDL